MPCNLNANKANEIKLQNYILIKGKEREEGPGDKYYILPLRHVIVLSCSRSVSELNTDFGAAREGWRE